MILVYTPDASVYTHNLYRDYIDVLNKQKLFCARSLEDILAAGQRTWNFSKELCDSIKIAYTKVFMLRRVIINNQDVCAWSPIEDDKRGIIIKINDLRVRPKVAVSSWTLPVKPIVAIHNKTGNVLHFKSMNEAERQGFELSSISRCVNGIRKSHAGYTWKYEDK